MKEADLTREATRQLQEAGYQFVEREVQISSDPKTRLRADLVAWAPDEDGRLSPMVVVECKRHPLKHPQQAAAQVAAYARALGAPLAYIFTGAWAEVSPDLSPPVPVPAPKAPLGSPHGVSLEGPHRRRFLRSLLRNEMLAIREHDTKEEPVTALATALERLAAAGRGTWVPETADVGPEPFQRLVLEPGPELSLDLAIAAAEITSTRFGQGQFVVPEHVVRGLARLLKPTVPGQMVDPYAGFGTLTWATLTLADVTPVVSYLYERHTGLASVLEQLRDLSGVRAEIRVMDFLDDSDIQADYLIAVPPLGARLTSPRPLPFGSTTNATVVTIDAITRSLKSGGRAVILIGRGLLFESGVSGRLRDYLAQQMRVTAVIGLPAGVLSPYTQIETAILVVEAKSPSETLVADLRDDWREQLETGGDFYEVYCSRLGDS